MSRAARPRGLTSTRRRTFGSLRAPQRRRSRFARSEVSRAKKPVVLHRGGTPVSERVHRKRGGNTHDRAHRDGRSCGGCSVRGSVMLLSVGPGCDQRVRAHIRTVRAHADPRMAPEQAGLVVSAARWRLRGYPSTCMLAGSLPPRRPRASQPRPARPERPGCWNCSRRSPTERENRRLRRAPPGSVLTPSPCGLAGHRLSVGQPQGDLRSRFHEIQVTGATRHPADPGPLNACHVAPRVVRRRRRPASGGLEFDDLAFDRRIPRHP